MNFFLFQTYVFLTVSCLTFVVSYKCIEFKQGTFKHLPTLYIDLSSLCF